MAYLFVTSISEAVANIENFNRDVANQGSLTPEEDRDLQILIARTELFALCRDPQGGWRAGPSKYIAVQNISPSLYTKIRREVHSGNAANHLRLWLPRDPVSQSHPGWQEVEALAKSNTIGARVKDCQGTQDCGVRATGIRLLQASAISPVEVGDCIGLPAG
jgi:hypothetical protein